MADLHRELIVALGQFVGGASTAEDVPNGVASRGASDVAGAAVAGVTMAGERGRPTTHVVTDKRAHEVNLAQYDADRGPCLEAWREDHIVSVPDVRAARARYGPLRPAGCLNPDDLLGGG